MKNRTRRQLGAWTRTPLATVSGIVGIAGFIATVLFAIYGGNARSWALLAALTVVGSIVAVRISLMRDSASEPKFFSPITFDDMTDLQCSEVLAQIAQGDSATPQFASIAPVPDELPDILGRLAADRIVYINGSPGEGKSTLAYHAALSLYPEGYSAYELRGSAINGFSREYMRENLLSQADALQGEFRLIIVDDAHLLERADDVKEVLLCSLDDYDTYLIWISMDYPESTANPRPKDTSVHIDYEKLAAKQGAFFRENVESGRLSGSLAALDEAADMSASGAIKTAWQYSFAAFGGGRRLAASLASLSNLEVFVMFQLSARAVATGALEVPMTKVQSILVDTSVGWVRDDTRDTSYRQVLYELSHRSAGRQQFLRIDASTASGAEVACLHYSFAREVVRESIERTAIAADLIQGLGSLIVKLKESQTPYLAVLLRDVRQYLGTFVTENERYVERYIYSSAGVPLAAAAEVLGILVKCRDDPEVGEFIERLNVNKIADRVNASRNVDIAALATAIRYLEPVTHLHENLLRLLEINKLAVACCGSPIQFQGVAGLVRELGARRDEMIERLDIAKLAVAVNSARPAQFQSVADLVRELGARRDEMIERLDIAKLAVAANSAQPSELRYIAELLRQLGRRRNQLLENLDLHAMSLTIGRAEPSEFGSIALFLQALGHREAQLIAYLDAAYLIRRASNAHASELRHVADLLWTLGNRRRAIFDSTILPSLDLEKLGSTISRAGTAELGQAAHLIHQFGRGRSAIVRHINITQVSTVISCARPSEFTSIANFMRELGERRVELIDALDVVHLARSASDARPGEFASIAFLARELGERRDEFIDVIDIIRLARSADNGRPGEFDSVAQLLPLLGKRSTEFVGSLDVEHLATTASHAQARDLRSVTVLIPLLGERRDEFIDTLDVEQLARTAAYAQTRHIRGVTDLRRLLGRREIEFISAYTAAKHA